MVRLKYAGSTLEELLDMSVVYANVRRTFCVVLVTVRKLFFGRYCIISNVISQSIITKLAINQLTNKQTVPHISLWNLLNNNTHESVQDLLLHPLALLAAQSLEELSSDQ